MAPASSHGIASTPADGNSRGNVIAARPVAAHRCDPIGDRVHRHVCGGRRTAFPAAAVNQTHRGLVVGVAGPLPRCQVDGALPRRQVGLGQVEKFGRVAQPPQMRVDQASGAIADQQCLENTVAAHGGQVVGEQQWRPRRV